MQEIRKIVEKVGAGDLETFKEVLKASMDIYDKLYSEAYEKITKRRGSGDSWPDIFSSDIYQDDPPSNEIMLRLVEDENKVKVKDARHLQKLTKIDLKLIDELEDTLLKAREFRYMRVLEYALNKGLKYSDLLTIDHRTFDLPDKWRGFIRANMNKQNAIGEALYFQSVLNPIFQREIRIGSLTMADIYLGTKHTQSLVETGRLDLGATLKEKAALYEAPYSVMLDAEETYNHWRKQKENGTTSGT